MPKELTLEDTIRLAQLIVQSWEGIPDKVNAFCTEYGEQYRKPIEGMMRHVAGGEEVYQASKDFLNEHTQAMKAASDVTDSRSG